MKQTNDRISPSAYWDGRLRAYGQTGDSNALIYEYDQPRRIRSIAKALARSGVQLNSETKILDIGRGTGDLVARFVG